MAGLVPAIHGLNIASQKTWMPGTRPGMTEVYITKQKNPGRIAAGRVWS